MTFRRRPRGPHRLPAAVAPVVAVASGWSSGRFTRLSRLRSRRPRSRGDDELPQPPEGGAGLPPPVPGRGADGEPGAAPDQDVEGDLRLQAREVFADAVVDAAAEGQVFTARPVDGEAVGLRVPRVVPVGGGEG